MFRPLTTLVALSPVLCTLAAPFTHQVGYINVSVATLWTNPNKPRPIDAPALTNPVHIEQWLGSMSVKQFRDLTDDDRTQTQALYGARVDIIGSKDDWYEVAVPEQPTPKNPLGYPGWVPAVQISFDSDYDRSQSTRSFAQVGGATTLLYRDAGLKDEIMQISYDTRLPVLRQLGKAVEVAVPAGGCAYISTSDTSIYSSASAIPYPTGEDLVASAKMFIGRPYLWGGTSGFAFDCSGFTHTLYESFGIIIGRDADAQADYTGHGTKVSRSELQAGDIIFYASNLSDPSSIYHDALYAGNDKMVEAYGAGVPVRITKVRFNDDYWGAERFLNH